MISQGLARQRWWIACLYYVVVVLAQGVHTHPEPLVGDDEVAHSSSGCGASHGASEPGTGTSISAQNVDCPACEFILTHHATLADRANLSATVRVGYVLARSAADPDSSLIRPRGRAPPLV